ncbi:hypothetical protein D9758_002492 [Tetrapyrgos nigripes]|uniref:Uncharacterized protein n=1 Tax=Tetrapyrgos nigripes TaxID=182062 RepID=A0A8H5GR71_9AGAR|nr:hypothetical protein D9758_002492 [Tetrapyrgos nigripes]
MVCTHPELIHLHGELSRRKDKRLELATKKRAFEVANLHKRRKLDEDGTWSWWKLARDELQTEMIAETNRKRRRLERDRRAVERPQPVRRIPQPPTELLLSPPTLRKVIKADPFNIKPQHTKREDRVSKRNGLAGHFSTAIDRPSSLAYPELATLNSSDVRSDLDLLASFKRPAQPPPAQPMFDGHPIGHGLPNRINTPNAMIPPSMPPNMYDHPYGAPPPPMNDNFAPFGAPGGRSIVSQSNMHPQGLSPYANAPSLGPGPGMGQGGRPGSSAGPSSAGPSRPYHIHRPPSPIMSNQPALGHGAHGSSPFTQAGMGPIEREQEMLLHSRPSSSFNDGGQPQGPPPGYGRRSPSPSGSMHAGSSLGRVHGMGYDDRVPVKVNFRDEREREALLNSKDPEIQHALMNSKDPEVRQFMADRDRNMSMHAEAEYMSRLNRSSKDEVLDRHFPPNGPYRDQDIMMDRVMDRDMRQSFGPTSEREKERLRREEMYKHNVPHHYRQPNHHHHHHKPHHHHVVHHHHVRQSSNATPASTSPRQANLSPRMSRGEPAENGVYNRALPPQSHPPPPPSHPTEAINLSSKGPPPSSVPWKGEDVQGRDYRDSRKINSRPPSGPPLLPGDERERDRHIPVPFAMGSSQPSSAVHSNGPSSTSSPRPAWNTTDHDDNYRSGTHPPPPGSPGHRFASSTSQMHPLGRNGSHVPAGSSGPQSPPRSRAYRPPSPSIVPPGPTRSPTRYRERSSPPMNHSKIIRPGSPSLPVPGRPASATSPPAPSSGPPPIDVMKNGTKPSSPDVTRSNGSGVLISSTPRLIGTHIEKSALSPRLSSNTSPPKMSVPQIVDSHS